MPHRTRRDTPGGSADVDPDAGARRGRPPLGPSLVEGVDCSDRARERLRLVLETLTGATTVVDACAQLGVGASRFHELRRRFLEDAAMLLEPRAPGPAPRAAAELDAQREIERLRRENADLRLQAHAARVREELAVAMPGRAARGAGAPGPGAGAGAKKKRRPRKSR